MQTWGEKWTSTMIECNLIWVLLNRESIDRGTAGPRNLRNQRNLMNQYFFM